MADSIVPIEGGLYVTCSKKAYGFLKVLKVEEEIVQVRLYRNKHEEIPVRIDPGSLELGTIYDKHGFGIRHLPISYETFASWQPQFLQHTLLSNLKNSKDTKLGKNHMAACGDRHQVQDVRLHEIR